MYAQHEETEILRGIDEILFNLKKVPIDDLAYFITKNDPEVAKSLFSQLFNNLMNISESN